MELEISTQNGRDLDMVDTSIEPTPPHPFHLHRRRNSLASPLLRLPTELILKIFAHTIGLGEDDPSLLDYGNLSSSNNDGLALLVLTAICHRLREIGTAYPQLWSTVDLTTLPRANLFIERCKYEPQILIVLLSPLQRRTTYPINTPQRAAAWDKLEGCTLNGLHSIAFVGTPHEFTCRVSRILRKAPNVSNLDLDIHWSHLGKDFLCLPGHLVPNLSTLRLRNFAISWTSPLFRNLIQLTIGFAFPGGSPEDPSVEAFLGALANCPNLEILSLAHAGPAWVEGYQDNCDVVVQLHRLRKLSLDFSHHSRIGYILSHIGYPESTELTVCITLNGFTGLPETISQALLRRNVETTHHFRNSTTLTVYLYIEPQFFTNNLFVRFRNRSSGVLNPLKPNAQVLPRFASKILEVIGGDAVTSLDMVTRRHGADLPEGMWEAFLHGLPRLERICYSHSAKEDGGIEDGYLYYRDFTDPFILVFSQQFEGGLVCPQLLHLELPAVILTQAVSATVLKRVLAERDACGRRLKRIGLSGGAAKVDDRLVLEPFRDLVDEAR